MERGVYLKKLSTGLKEWPGVQIIMNATRIGGSWANWYEGMFKCGGFQGQDMICVKDLDAKFEQYQKSFNRDERKKLAEEIQRGDPGKLLLRPGVPPRLRQRDRAADQGREMAGRLPDDHDRLRLSLGGHRAEGSRRRAELGQGGTAGVERRQ